MITLDTMRDVRQHSNERRASSVPFSTAKSAEQVVPFDVAHVRSSSDPTTCRTLNDLDASQDFRRARCRTIYRTCWSVT